MQVFTTWKQVSKMSVLKISWLFCSKLIHSGYKIVLNSKKQMIICTNQVIFILEQININQRPSKFGCYIYIVDMKNVKNMKQ